MTHNLTPAQKEFFASYVVEFDEDELPRSVNGMTPEQIQAAREKFVTTTTEFDFDGDATPAEIRVAKNLKEAGFLSEANPHTSRASETPDLLEVMFTQKGLDALFNIATGLK